MLERRRAKVVSLAVGALLFLGAVAVHQGLSANATASLCGQQLNTSDTAFCDTFTTAQGTGNRSGDLNGDVWGVSRTTGNMGFNQPDAWANSTLALCGSNVTVNSTTDVRVCNGQLRESSNDNISGAFDAGTVTTLAMYPKQPFDFAGRTGTISFDVTDDSKGTHGSWPEFWLTDKPLPAPFTHFGSWKAIPQNGLGLRFATACPNGGIGVDSAVVVRNLVTDDTANGGSLNLVHDGCVVASSGPDGLLNHFEIRVSQTAITVYGSNAGSTTLVQIAHITNPALQFTRGLVWIEDAHYNADKNDVPTPHDHTFTWDNVAFDGPTLPRDLTFDVLDSGTPITNGRYLGWQATTSSPANLSTLPVTNIADASTSLLMFNWWNQDAGVTFTYSVNGHQHTQAAPDGGTFTWHTVGLTVPLSDLVAGPNTLSIRANVTIEIANVDLLLVGAGGLPSSSTPTATPPSPTASPSATATDMPTLVPTATSTSTSTSTPTAAPTATSSSTPTPSPTATPTAGGSPSPSLCYRSDDGGQTIVRVAC